MSTTTVTPTNLAHAAGLDTGRLVSLDVFRGATVAAMLLVNNPGNWNAIYWPLDHADWNGWTPTDLIFPFFLFIVGITTYLSLESRKARGDSGAELRRQVLRRAAIIFALGLFLNWFPGFSVGHIAGDPDFLARVVRKLLHVRVMGVLQRIAVVYAVTGFIALAASLRVQIGLLAALLLGYWAISVLVPVPDTGATGLAAIADRSHTLAAWIDRGALNWGAWGNHLWSQAKTWDPEGLLSTLPAIGTAILGLLAGRWIQSPQALSRRILFLLVAGMACVAVGLLWGQVFPINKKLWTSSFVIFTGGMAAAMLACSMWLIDLRASRWWTEPLRVFGVNPVLAFVASNISALLIYVDFTVTRNGHRIAVEEWFNDVFLASWLPDKVASLAFALLFVTVWWAILRIFLKRGILIKI
jgi:predicted acyltransferase